MSFKSLNIPFTGNQYTGEERGNPPHLAVKMQIRRWIGTERATAVI